MAKNSISAMYTHLYFFHRSYEISFICRQNKMKEDNQNAIKCYFFKRDN